MRRPINWVVVCLSLLLLVANLSSGSRLTPPVMQLAATPMTTQLEFSRTVFAERAAPQFGYIRDDGSFLPLADDTAVVTSASPSWR